MTTRVLTAADGLTTAVRVLAAGGIVGFPTDTVYALGVDPRSESAVQRLFQVKDRPRGTVTPLVAASKEQVAEVASYSDLAAALADAFWPGPLTLVLRARVVLPEGVVNPSGGVGLRVPDHPVARQLAMQFEFPVTASSANLSGSEPALTAFGLSSVVPGLDVIIDGGPSLTTLPSTVLDLTSGDAHLVREGAVSRAMLEEALHRPIAQAEQ